MLLLKKSMYHVLILNQSFMIFPCRGKVVKAPLEAPYVIYYYCKNIISIIKAAHQDNTM